MLIGRINNESSVFASFLYKMLGVIQLAHSAVTFHSGKSHLTSFVIDLKYVAEISWVYLRMC